VVHNAEAGIEYPYDPSQVFAVVSIKGQQHKVAKDDRIMCEKLPFEVGQQIELGEVLLVGTQDYTSVGRPVLDNAKVYATVEEKSTSEKVIVFKKRRRKGYQNNNSHVQELTYLRIDDIKHQLTEETMADYHELKV
jgi:large subunit ribosomal protein L21